VRWILDALPDYHEASWVEIPGSYQALPRLRAQPQPTPHKKRSGRPKRAEHSPVACLQAACCRDLGQLTNRQIDSRLYFASDGSRSSSKTVTSYIRDGRQLLSTEGVLPWALWQGAPPKGWWKDDAFLRGLAVWAWEGKRQADRRFKQVLLGNGPLEERAEGGLCPPSPPMDADRIIASYVRVNDGFEGDAMWRRSKPRHTLYLEARALGFR